MCGRGLPWQGGMWQGFVKMPDSKQVICILQECFSCFDIKIYSTTHQGLLIPHDKYNRITSFYCCNIPNSKLATKAKVLIIHVVLK